MANKTPIPMGMRQSLKEVLNKCDNVDLWTPTKIIYFISDYLTGIIWEKLPEYNQTSKKSLQVELSKEVLEAMEELREILTSCYGDIKEGAIGYGLAVSSKYLLNTLDNQFNSSEVEEDCPNEQAALDWNTEDDCKERKQSIWKPVSELLENDIDILIRYTDGNILLGYTARDKIYANILEDRIGYVDPIVVAMEMDDEEIEVCTITDFINQHNSLLDRVERLERIIGGENE